MSSNDDPPRRGAGEEDYPPWISIYLENLSIKEEQVKVEQLENILEDCENV